MSAPRRSSLGFQVVSFDADGTLWDFDATMRRALTETIRFLATHDPRLESLSIDELIEARQRIARGTIPGATSMEQLRLAGFTEALQQRGSRNADLVREATSFYLKARFEDPILYPDVVDTLDVLAERARLALVTNGNSDPERCGLPGRFAHVVFATEVGVAKPDPAIFDALVGRAGCAPDQILHVGDSRTDDVYGATAAGTHAVWLNRSGETPAGDPGMLPTTITSLAELPSVLDRWPVR